jgi:hypothetical protein
MVCRRSSMNMQERQAKRMKLKEEKADAFIGAAGSSASVSADTEVKACRNGDCMQLMGFGLLCCS